MKKYNLINNMLGWVCFVVAAVTYLLTLEPTASFWDCPEFISQGAKLEVGHPPGNPIFMLAARFFVTIFGNNIANAAIAVNTMSALLSAATILLLFWTITHIARRIIVRDDASEVSLWEMVMIFGAGICGALAYTWSDTFWFSAVEGEVYAFSSFCTALVFWLILKWENRASQPHSDRYLVLIAYVIGISIAVHLLNLLCIPAIVLVFYYKKFKNVTAKGSIVALLVSFVIVALILYGLVPGFVKVAQWFELLFVNTFGMSYNTGVLFYAIILVASFLWAICAIYRQKSASAIKWSFLVSLTLSGMPFIGQWWMAALLVAVLGGYLLFACNKVPVRIFNVIILSVFLIFVGYSSYALLLIRSHANTPMNQNAPDNVFALGSYLNREQYGERPLFYGSTFAEELVLSNAGTEENPLYVAHVDEYGRPLTRTLDGVLRDETGNPYSDPSTTYAKVPKTSKDQPDQYVEKTSSPNYGEIPGLKMMLPRIYSTLPAHISGYKGWSQYSMEDLDNIPQEVRARWAAQRYAPLYELMPYLSDTERVATYIDHDGREIDYSDVWKPGMGANLRFFFNYQFAHMYWRYFMWNFAGRQNDFQGNGEPHLGNWISGIPVIDNARLGDQSLLPDEFGEGNKGHNVFYMLPLLLGIIGLLWQALYVKPDAPQRGIEQFWVICFLFFMTGIAIVLYLNQTPGQPRERDYAFAGSFYAFAIWIGMGVPAIGMMLRNLIAGKKNQNGGSKQARIISGAVAVVVALAIPLQMVSQTWDDHDRSGRYTARDFGMNYLSSVAPDGIIFCNGDNDTFPLWYAQEVEGYRTDVRVVNLSYLTTDWYANQQRIPSYDGKPVPMFAKPTDYANERMAYAFAYPVADTIVPVEFALEELYRSPAMFQQPVMTYPTVEMAIDTVAVARYFALDTVSAASRLYKLPYVSAPSTDIYRYLQENGKSGLNLGNTLSLDIIANSVKNNFERPVYFASTVPSNYYLGLSPYMYSTGLASMVTPFRDAPVSPMVEDAYENIVGSFRWGGLDIDDPASLYLDETVRRMVSSTRTSIYSVARDLIASGELPASQWAVEYARQNGTAIPATRYDMARNLLNLMLGKLPASAAPLDGQLVVYLAQSYYDLYVATHNKSDLDAARAIVAENLPRFAEFTRYVTGLSPTSLALVGYDLDYAQYLAALIAMQNRLDILEALERNPVANAEILDTWAQRTAYDLHPTVSLLIYAHGVDIPELQNELAMSSGSTAMLLQAAITNLQASKAAGIDPMALSRKTAEKYGFDIAAWANLL